MQMSDLELIIGNKNYSSWSLRPWLFLQQAGVPFRETLIRFQSPEWSERIPDLSPAGLVPVLRDTDLTVWDSLAILEYLAERFPEARGWPEDASERARARSASAEMHSGFLALRNECPQDVRSRTPGRPFSAALRADVTRVQQVWRECLERSGGPFLFGDFTIADAMYAPVALRFVTYEIEVDPKSQGYVDTICALPAIREWIRGAEAEPDVFDPFDH